MSAGAAGAPLGRRRGDARGGGARQGLRRPADGAALALRRALSRRGGAHAGCWCFPSFLLELAPAWIVKTGLDHLVGRGRERRASGRWLAPPAGLPPLAWLAGVYLAVMVAGSAVAYLQLAGDVAHRPGRDARPAQRRVRAHPAAAPRLLRPLSGRTPGHARDQRRRERLRDVLGRDRRAGDRRAQDDRIRGGALPGRRAARRRSPSWWCRCWRSRRSCSGSRCARPSAPCACGSRASTPISRSTSPA